MNIDSSTENAAASVWRSIGIAAQPPAQQWDEPAAFQLPSMRAFTAAALACCYLFGCAAPTWLLRDDRAGAEAPTTTSDLPKRLLATREGDGKRVCVDMRSVAGVERLPSDSNGPLFRLHGMPTNHGLAWGVVLTALGTAQMTLGTSFIATDTHDDFPVGIIMGSTMLASGFVQFLIGNGLAATKSRYL